MNIVMSSMWSDDDMTVVNHVENVMNISEDGDTINNDQW